MMSTRRAIFDFKADMEKPVHHAIGKVKSIILNDAAIALDQVIARFHAIRVIAMCGCKAGEPQRV